MDRLTENMKIWLRALYLEEIEHSYSAARTEHYRAMGSRTNQESDEHEHNADEYRAYAHILEDMAAELLKE